MAGKVNTERERGIVKLFVDLHPLGLQVVEYRDKPDALVQSSTGQTIGLEVTEVLLPEDGNDRHLEAVACAGMKRVCRELLGPCGDVTVRMHTRPVDRAQVDRWVEYFWACVSANRETILKRGGMWHGVFPVDRYSDACAAVLREYGASAEDIAAEEAAHARWNDLKWLHVETIHLAKDADGWRVYGSVGTDHFADRHEQDIDDLVVDSVKSKVLKAAGYDLDGPTWLVVRSPVRAAVSEDVSARVASLPGVERFAEIWLLDSPANTIDATRPPAARILYRRT